MTTESTEPGAHPVCARCQQPVWGPDFERGHAADCPAGGVTVTAELLWVSPAHAAEMRDQIATLRADVARLIREKGDARNEVEEANAAVGVAEALSEQDRERADDAERERDAARAEAERLREEDERLRWALAQVAVPNQSDDSERLEWLRQIARAALNEGGDRG